MYEELRKKKKVMDSFRPFSNEFKATYNNINLLDFAYMNLKLDGSSLTKEGVNAISRGELIDHVSVIEHCEVQNHKELLKTFNNMLEMDMDIDEKQLVRLYMVLTDKTIKSFRENNDMLYHLDYMPPRSNDIEESLTHVFKRIFMADFGENCIKKAVFIHNKIIEVYPFEEKSEALARTAMEYELIKCGFPVIPFELSETDYNSMLSEYLKTGEFDPLYENLLYSAVKKYDLLLGILREEDMDRV